MGFIESLLPFNKMMTATGLAEQESWKKCLTYCRAVFYRIHEVRTVSTDRTLGVMVYGMMQVTCLLESYGKLGWICHPDVSSALVIASLQKEGKVIETAMTKGKEKADQVEKNKRGWECLDKELKKLKEKNPSWNT